MGRHDAQIEVVCDECGDNEFWEPEYTYSDYSGKNGSYDTTDAAFSNWCGSNSWTEKGEKTYCENCAETLNE